MGFSVLTSVMVSKTIPVATLVDVLRGILANQQVLAEACGVELPFVVGDGVLDEFINNDRAKEGDIVLPLVLRKTMLHGEAFDAAVEKGYIVMTEDGHFGVDVG